MNENEQSPSYDLDRRRPIELAMLIHDPDKGPTMRRAVRKKRTACDGLFVVQIFRDDEKLSFMTASYDGHTLETLSTKELFHMWVSLAGHIVRNHVDDRDAEALRQKRFVLAVLTQLRLSSKLGRLEENAPKTEMPVGVTSPALDTVEGAAEPPANGELTVEDLRQAYHTLNTQWDATSPGQDRRSDAPMTDATMVDPDDVDPGESN